MTAKSKVTASSAAESKRKTPAQPTFFPPEQQPMVVRLVQSISHPLARLLYKLRLSVTETEVGKLRAIDDARLVYVCNHPTMEDGISLFVFSARIGQMFHYIVAYEAFKGLMGWFIQKLGCYSIRRGLGDRASISATLALLKSPRCRLVIFPEGGCSYQNDTIMPFRPGAIQLPMSALAQLAKKAPSLDAVPDMYIVPLSLKYRYQQSMDRVIEQTLARLEQALNIQPEENNAYQRLRSVAHQVILAIEAEARAKGTVLPEQDDLDWNQRIDRLRDIYIARCEAALDISPTAGLPIRERVYKVQAILEDLEATGAALSAAGDESTVALLSPHPLSTKERSALYWDTIRLLNFDAIYDGYVAEAPTQERFLDTLIRLEREVFHIEHAQPKAPRIAHIRVSDPINLKDYLADYQRDRTGTIERLSQTLHHTMQSNLEDLSIQFSGNQPL